MAEFPGGPEGAPGDALFRGAAFDFVGGEALFFELADEPFLGGATGFVVGVIEDDAEFIGREGTTSGSQWTRVSARWKARPVGAA